MSLAGGEWGLRDYGEGANTVWGGDPDCEHEWVIETTKHDNLRPSKVSERTIVGSNKELRFRTGEKVRSAFCVRCNAWYGQLGLEPSLDMYIEHLLEIMRELKRVLKKTGVIFWVHGDCYGGSGCGRGDYRNNNKRSLSNPNLYCEKPNPHSKLTPKCMALQNFRFIIRCVDELGLILRNVIIWYKPNHMPSSVKDRFTSAYEPVFMLVKSKKYWFDLDAVRVPQ
ncbi:MAG TPA: site-specific DNA-methyltransferase, partial [Thermococcus litoralis]|nr:site-specific DNA-methyltransferase [Thermococcus litoralis]